MGFLPEAPLRRGYPVPDGQAVLQKISNREEGLASKIIVKANYSDLARLESIQAIKSQIFKIQPFHRQQDPERYQFILQ